MLFDSEPVARVPVFRLRGTDGQSSERVSVGNRNIATPLSDDH